MADIQMIKPNRDLAIKLDYLICKKIKWTGNKDIIEGAY